MLKPLNLLVCCSLLLAFAAARLLSDRSAAAALPESGEPTWKLAGRFELAEVPEPSGMCFVTETQALFIVDDGGVGRKPGVYEVNQQGEVLRRLAIGRDLEGICYCPPERSLHIANETDERVWVVDLDSFAVRGSYQVSRSFEGREVLKAGGNGFEGIEYIERTPTGDGDYFLLLNQDDPHALMRVNRSGITLDGPAPVSPAQFHELPELNLGELHYDAARGELWVIHSWQNVYQLLDIDSLAQLSWQVMPGAAQEAVCLDDQGRLWVGSDTGGLSLYELTVVADAQD